MAERTRPRTERPRGSIPGSLDRGRALRELDEATVELSLVLARLERILNELSREAGRKPSRPT